MSSAVSRPTRRSHVVEPPPIVSVIHTRSSRRQTQETVEHDSDRETLSMHGSEDGSMTPSPSEASSSSRTPSPINSPSASYSGIEEASQQAVDGRRRQRRSVDERLEDISDEDRNTSLDSRSYGDQILEYFISDTNQIPPLLISPPADFDPNMPIDDDSHTALHWGCAMGRIRVVKLLLTAGADIYRVNKSGQTALMRSVMFANNYDVRKFPELYELLHRSTLNVDSFNRTVFHHVVDVAMSKGKTHAARYYMETILNRLSDYPKELADVINFQDEDGETALTMAARCRSKRLVKLLIDHGADPKIMNNDGKSAEDYILEDERFRSSPVPPSRVASMSFRAGQVAYPPINASVNYSFAPMNGDRPPLHHSTAAQRASTRCVNDMATLLDSLASSFDQELKDKERDMNQAHALLANIQAEILESQRAVNNLKGQAEGLVLASQNLQHLEQELLTKMGRRYRLGWEKWVKDEEVREKSVGYGDGGKMALDPSKQEETKAESGFQGDQTGGKRQFLDEDNSDLEVLYANVPTDPAELKRACDSLREDIPQHRKRRKTMFEELVTFQAEAGTGGRMGEYRRLIAAGCGGVSPSEIDHVLGMLLEVRIMLCRWTSLSISTDFGIRRAELIINRLEWNQDDFSWIIYLMHLCRCICICNMPCLYPVL